MAAGPARRDHALAAALGDALQPRPDGAVGGLEQPAQRLRARRRDRRGRARRRGGHHPRRAERRAAVLQRLGRLPEQDAADGVAGLQGRAAGHRPGGRAGGAAPGVPGPGDDRRARQHRPARGLPGRHRVVLAAPTRCRAGWTASAPDGVEVDLGLRWRLLVQLAALGGTDRPTLDRVPRRRAHRDLPGRPRARGRLAARTTPRRRGRGGASPGPRTCPTTSSRPPDRACGCPARSTSRRRTSSGSSPTCPRRPRTARAGCSPTRRAGSSRSPRRTPRPCDRAARLAGDETLDLSLRRQLRVMADELQRRLRAREVPA